jgi:hypothetical protein
MRTTHSKILNTGPTKLKRHKDHSEDHGPDGSQRIETLATHNKTCIGGNDFERPATFLAHV